MLRLQGERLADIVLAEPERELEPPLAPRRDAPARLELHGVRFRYSDTEPEVLRGVHPLIVETAVAPR